MRYLGLALLVVVACGCRGRALGPKVVKNVAAGGAREVGREAPKVQRPLLTAEDKRQLRDLAKDQAVDWAKDQFKPAPPPLPLPERFPVDQLRADPATMRYSPDGRSYTMLNNFGGANGYDAGTGRLVMFSAVHRQTGQTHYFNAAGYRTR
jgi:hypothetical protein